jgi:hypothetical protein
VAFHPFVCYVQFSYPVTGFKNQERKSILINDLKSTVKIDGWGSSVILTAKIFVA